MLRLRNIRRMLRIFKNRDRRSHDDLEFILSRFREHTTSLQRASAVYALMHWLMVPMASFQEQEESYGRIALFCDKLVSHPNYKVIAQEIYFFLKHATTIPLVTESGLHSEGSFFSEAKERLLKRLLPTPFEPTNLVQFFESAFSQSSKQKWVYKLPPESFELLKTTILGGVAENSRDKVTEHYVQEIFQSIHFLASDIQALALSPSVRKRLHKFSLVESPFVQLNSLSGACLAHATVDPHLETTLLNEVFDVAVSCELQIQSVYSGLDSSGISIDLVYRIERIKTMLRRFKMCVETIRNRSPETTILFVAQLAEAQSYDKSISVLFGDTMRQISQRIVERTSDGGEHYITSSRKEYYTMLAGAAGGGAFTTLTAVIKYSLGGMHLPYFFDGLFSAINYSACFVIMHFAGLKLATKQPSMTASHLAKKLEESQSSFEHSEFIALVARITRSQFIAIAGNIGAVIPTTLLFCYVYGLLSGHSFFEPTKAQSTVDSLSPFVSMTLWYAALTGVFLWVSSMAGGWIENWLVHRRIPEALSTRPLFVNFFSRSVAKRAAQFIENNAAGVWSSVFLGFLLAYAPIFGTFFGLPIDARHVTLSTAALSLSALSGVKLLAFPFLSAVFGIMCIGFLNFTVSFAIALFIALRARNINIRGLSQLFQSLGKEFLARPRIFFLPPKE